jgi:predicted nuclease of predicted toxin-antitoxin system
VRLLIDAQLPTSLASLFVEAGHEAIHVADAGMLADHDVAIGRYAAEAGMIAVTKDEDFAVMRRLSSGAPSVLWVRFGNATNRLLGSRMEPLMPEILAAFEAGEPIVEVS